MEAYATALVRAHLAQKASVSSEESRAFQTQIGKYAHQLATAPPSPARHDLSGTLGSKKSLTKYIAQRSDIYERVWRSAWRQGEEPSGPGRERVKLFDEVRRESYKEQRAALATEVLKELRSTASLSAASASVPPPAPPARSRTLSTVSGAGAAGPAAATRSSRSGSTGAGAGAGGAAAALARRLAQPPTEDGTQQVSAVPVARILMRASHCPTLTTHFVTSLTPRLSPLTIFAVHRGSRVVGGGSTGAGGQRARSQCGQRACEPCRQPVHSVSSALSSALSSACRRRSRSSKQQQQQGRRIPPHQQGAQARGHACEHACSVCGGERLH